MLVIEVDEGQHAYRPGECEQTRMVNISQSYGMATVFLRFNPDKYQPAGSGPMISTPHRLTALAEWINRLKEQPPKDFLSVMYLFFDGYKEGAEVLETILPYEDSSP